MAESATYENENGGVRLVNVRDGESLAREGGRKEKVRHGTLG